MREHTIASLVASSAVSSSDTPSLAALVAHEVKNPLGSLKLFLALLRSDLGETSLSADQTEYLDQMEGSIRAIDRVVTSMLTSTDRVRERWGPVNIHALLRELAAMVAPRIEQAKVVAHADKQLGVASGTVTVDTNGSPFILGNEGALRQALLNILVNACEAAGRQGCVTISCADYDDEAIEIRVRDSGPGVAPQMLARVFDPFFSTKEGGSGLGLALVRETIIAHRGHISFEREVDTRGARSAPHTVCVVVIPRDGVTAPQGIR